MRAFSLLSKVSESLKTDNRRLIAAISEDGSDAEIEQFIASIDYAAIKRVPEYTEARKILVRIMELVAKELASNWDDPRYSREVVED